MNITLCAVGRLTKGPAQSLVDNYADRINAIGRQAGVSSFVIREVEAPKGLSGAKRQAKESESLIATAPKEAVRIALDEKGKALSSTAFAKTIAEFRDQGVRDLAFFIGGADGHSENLLSSAHKKIAFGPATWPHMLARVMICEQVYRAITISTGHPYHRD